MNLKTTALISGDENTDKLFDRELSWLSFNERVLMQAALPHLPLGERLRFIAISADNLDEFYMVRIAGMMQLHARGYQVVPETDGRLDELLDQVLERSNQLRDGQQHQLDRFLADFAEVKGCIRAAKELSEEQISWLRKWYKQNLLPLLSPTTIDPSHPFPFIQNKGKGVLMEMVSPDKKPVRAVILIPDNCPRFIRLPGDGLDFVAAETAIILFSDMIYPHFRIKKSGVFRILRDSEIEIDDEAEDLISHFERALRQRRRGNVVSLTLSEGLSKDMVKFLQSEMQLSPEKICLTDGFVGFGDLAQLLEFFPKPLLYPPLKARFPQRILDFKGDCFAAIQNKDLIVHHPYESFDAVVRFLQQAADDPDVLAIRQTLYRTTSQSPIAQALIRAAEQGKSVTALIELKARFDEENNIQLARSLERAGAHVAYGLGDLKVHSKLSLVMRREGDKIVSYAHCGTGNYHPITSKVYTDFSFFTCDKAICEDIWRVFNYLTSYVMPDDLKKMKISPDSAHQWLLDSIDREIEAAKAGKPAFIWAKTNALVERKLINKFYQASQAGVNITLVVRGICCLRPGIAGLSDNITVKSLIGRFLEHGRIYVFGNGDVLGSAANQIYIASADMMPRNMYRRVESFIPLENQTVRKQILEQVVPAIDEDTENCWQLQSDGCYVKAETDGDGFSSHDYFMQNPSLSGQGSLSGERGEQAKETGGR